MNARSLCPKLRSLNDCMNEMGATAAVVTETWLRDGQGLREVEERLEEKDGLRIITRNRNPLANGVAYGGVAILWKIAKSTFVEVPIKNNCYEVLVGAGTVQ